MAASGKTNNLKLPIYVEGNETTSWADYNESMQKIDIFAGENKSKTDTNTEAIQTINDQLQTIVTEQNNNNETAQRLDSRVQAIDRNIVTINGTLSSHNQRIATLESEGDEIGSLVTTVAEHTTEIGQLNTEITELRDTVSLPNTKILYSATSSDISLHGAAELAYQTPDTTEMFMIEPHGYCSNSVTANNSILLTSDANYLFYGYSGFITYYDSTAASYVSKSCTVSQTGNNVRITINPSGAKIGKGVIVLNAVKIQS